MSERKNELGKTQMTGAVFVDEARSYLDRLLHAESRGPGDFGNALHRIARRERLPHAALWGLRYRPPKDVYASTLFKLRDAYPSDWHLHKDEEKYLGFVFDHCREVDTPAAGDVAVFRYGRCWAHGGIVTSAEPLTIVHAFSPAGCVVEEEVARNSSLGEPHRAPRFFRLREAAPMITP